MYGFINKNDDKACEKTNSLDSYSNLLDNNSAKERTWTIRLLDDKIRVHLGNTKIIDYEFSKDGCQAAWEGTYNRVKFWSADDVSTGYRLSPGIKNEPPFTRRSGERY